MDVEEIRTHTDCRALIVSLGARPMSPGRYTAPWRPDSDSGSVAVEREKWFDHVEGKGGDCFSMVQLATGRDFQAALEYLGGTNGNSRNVGITKPTKPAKTEPASEYSSLVATYNYTDEHGKLLYQACRYEPGLDGRSKSFSQRHQGPDGKWVYNMRDVRKVPYNLPAVMTAETVWIAEGEKDCDTLNRIGFVATTNVAGALKWSPGYSEYLRNKNVVLCPDNDEAGAKHKQAVLDSLAGIVKSVTIVTVPIGKDITDYVQTLPPEQQRARVDDLAAQGKKMPGGIDLPILSMADMGRMYAAQMTNIDECSLDLSLWLPGLSCIRPLVPGEMATITAGTGVGKSMALQNIAHCIKLPTLFFELELPPELMFERFASLDLRKPGNLVQADYQNGRDYELRNLSHVYVCPKSRISVQEMTDIIRKAELVMGTRPVVVMLDYMQLLASPGVGRYEKMSVAAEAVKVMAKETNTIVIIASQIRRKQPGDSPDVDLSDCKDSGSIENSSGLVLGMWRDSGGRLLVRVNKSTKGGAGNVIPCRMQGDRMLITEILSDDEDF